MPTQPYVPPDSNPYAQHFANGQTHMYAQDQLNAPYQIHAANQAAQLQPAGCAVLNPELSKLTHPGIMNHIIQQGMYAAAQMVKDAANAKAQAPSFPWRAPPQAAPAPQPPSPPGNGTATPFAGVPPAGAINAQLEDHVAAIIRRMSNDKGMIDVEVVKELLAITALANATPAVSQLSHGNEFPNDISMKTTFQFDPIPDVWTFRHWWQIFKQTVVEHSKDQDACFAWIEEIEVINMGTPSDTGSIPADG